MRLDLKRESMFPTAVKVSQLTPSTHGPSFIGRSEDLQGISSDLDLSFGNGPRLTFFDCRVYLADQKAPCRFETS
jgi:hypothetical protein